jgi:hypothetical protein
VLIDTYGTDRYTRTGDCLAGCCQHAGTCARRGVALRWYMCGEGHMRSSSGYIFGIGIGLLVLSVLNHFVFKVNPIVYTTRIVFALGLVLAVTGAVFAFVRSGKSR